MANIIQIKRSPNTTSPSSLSKGELAWVDHGTGGVAGILYIGDATAAGAVVRSIGGPGWAAPLASPTLTGNPTAPTQSQSDNSTKLSTTAYVDTAISGLSTTISGQSDTNIVSPATGHVLIYDGANSWDNKPLSGDVTISTAGVTTIGSGSVDNDMLAGSIVNSKLSNSSITVSDGSNSTATSLGGTITFAGTNNEVTVVESGGTVTVGLPNDVTIAGDLIVSGTTTTVNSTTVTIADPIFTLGQNASDDNKDRGIEFKYNDGTAKIGFFGYDDSSGKFTFLSGATNSTETFSGTLGDVAFGNIDGTLTTTSQTAITGVGTITTGTWESTDIGVAYGGTGASSFTSNGIVYGNGAGVLQVTAAGTDGYFLKSNSGTPEWTNIIDGGIF